MEMDTPKPVEKIDEQHRERRFYKAADTPPLPMIFLFGFQQVMVCVSALLTIPFILSSELCAGRDCIKLRVDLISSTFVSSGISTIIQTLLGTRLALLQGTAFACIPTIRVFMKIPEYQCHSNSSDFVEEILYHNTLSIIQGCLILSSIIPIVIGMTGLVGVLTKFIGPMTVSPLMLLLVISSVDMCVVRISKHWVAVVQAIALFATVMYLAEVRVPVPGVKEGRFHWYRVPLFGQYPYLIAILISWAFCLFLTVTDLADSGSEARLDKAASMEVLRNAPWFKVPHPGQFGVPKLHVGLLMGFILSALTSVIESVGDYHAAARVSQERSPPSHAVNRGILAEGLGSFISGWLGTGVGMTTHTENIGVIGVTRVASRWTMVCAGVLLIALGLFTKIGAILSTIPEPLVGGVLASSMAMVSGVAIANLQQVDMTLTRNMAILGFSLMVGMIIPGYFKAHPVHTGVNEIDQLLTFSSRCPCSLERAFSTTPSEVQLALKEVSLREESCTMGIITMMYIHTRNQFRRSLTDLPVPDLSRSFPRRRRAVAVEFGWRMHPSKICQSNT
ncbi:hypothetical protein PMAYCL1PPCAC_28372, partial [Pristionchus mayeri]